LFLVFLAVSADL